MIARMSIWIKMLMILREIGEVEESFDHHKTYYGPSDWEPGRKACRGGGGSALGLGSRNLSHTRSP